MPGTYLALSFERKIVARDDLAARVAALPRPVVLTNGVFDILHRGHVSYLSRARALEPAQAISVIPAKVAASASKVRV